MRRSLGTVALLSPHTVALRGADSGHSLELDLSYVIDGRPEAEPRLAIYGHAGARKSILDLAGIDTLIDALLLIRARIEREA